VRDNITTLNSHDVSAACLRRISTTQQKKTKLIRIAKARITNNAKASKLQPQSLAINDRAKRMFEISQSSLLLP
jgi:hypothetical protein